MIKLIKFILLILFLILSFQKLLIANNNSSLVDKISKNLRCLICQGQSVYDSQSDFALSMKLLIKNKIDEGKSEKQIYEYLKNQYGEWIVYDPEFDKKNLILWTFPLILFQRIIRNSNINWENIHDDIIDILCKIMNNNYFDHHLINNINKEIKWIGIRNYHKIPAIEII